MVAATDSDLGPVLAVGSGHGPPLEAVGLTNAEGAQAILVRDGERPRLLVATERVSGGHERLVIAPFDAGHEIRREGDALAAWIARPPVTRRVARVPAWASVLGYVLVVGVAGLTILGSLTLIGWLGAMLAGA